MYTVFSKPEETRGDWYLVDAAGKTLGRLASQIAHRLKGKHKPNYAPHQDLGDHIVVINAGTVRVTGAKLTDKFYHQHTGYVGNLKSIALGKLLKEHPERAVEFAVKGMLPKGPLGRRMYKKLHVFGGNAPSPSSTAAQSAGILNSRRKTKHGIKHSREYLLRHRPPQDLERAGVPQPGHRQGLHQRPHSG